MPPVDNPKNFIMLYNPSYLIVFDTIEIIAPPRQPKFEWEKIKKINEFYWTPIPRMVVVLNATTIEKQPDLAYDIQNSITDPSAYGIKNGLFRNQFAEIVSGSEFVTYILFLSIQNWEWECNIQTGKFFQMNLVVDYINLPKDIFEKYRNTDYTPQQILQLTQEKTNG